MCVAEKPCVYVAIGASDATGVGASSPSMGYPNLIIKNLRAVYPDASIKNLGVNGATTEIIINQVLPIAMSLKPTLVTVFVGVNDITRGVSPTVFGQNLKYLLNNLTKVTEGDIFIATLPDLLQLPVFTHSPYKKTIESMIIVFNQIIYDQAKQSGALIVNLAPVDIASILVSSQDGFHPSTLGHEKLANLFWREISAKNSGPVQQ